jgi:hypothetical protein
MALVSMIVLTKRTIRAGLLAAILTPAVAFAQSAPPSSAGSSDTPTLPAPSPAQVARIQRALDQPPGLKLDERQLRFYLEIVQRLPTFAEYSRGYDFLNGPTTGGNPMSHSEFIKLVTPKEMYSSAGITASEQVQGALTNYVGQALIRKALEELRQAKDAYQVQAIRERIDRELDALTGVSRDKTQSDRSKVE